MRVINTKVNSSILQTHQATAPKPSPRAADMSRQCLHRPPHQVPGREVARDTPLPLPIRPATTLKRWTARGIACGTAERQRGQRSAKQDASLVTRTSCNTSPSPAPNGDSDRPTDPKGVNAERLMRTGGDDQRKLKDASSVLSASSTGHDATRRTRMSSVPTLCVLFPRWCCASPTAVRCSHQRARC